MSKQRYPTREITSVVDQLRKGWSKVPEVLASMGYDGLREGQKPVICNILAGKDTLCVLPTGCHARGQELLMFDGTTKCVEDIQVGDQLIGPDSTPRTVLQLCRGSGTMVRIVPKKGDSFVVNEDHILTLVKTKEKGQPRYPCQKEHDTLIDVSVKEWMGWSKWRKHTHKLVRSSGVEFAEQSNKLPTGLHPYVLGVYLGGGDSNSGIRIHARETEIRDKVSKLLHESLHTTDLSTKTNIGFAITNKQLGCRSNIVKQTLRDLDLLKAGSGEKHIPHFYKTASKKDRLELLAGLMDTDGSLCGGCFDYISKSSRLANDVLFIARSLGFSAHLRNCSKSSQDGTSGTYYRVCISGDVDLIPTAVLRKQALARKSKKSVLRTAFTVQVLENDSYYGFVLDKDHRYLMDDYTITHNSGKTACFVVPTLALEWKTIVFSPLVALMRDQVQSLQRMRIPALAMSSMQSDAENAFAAEQWAQGNLSFLYVAPERLHNPKFKNIMDQTPPDMLVLDEAHTLSQWSENFRSSYCKVGDFIAEKKPKVVAAFTATCPSEVEQDVRRVLGISQANKIVYYPRRTNLHLQSRELESETQIADVLKYEIDGPAIVYCSTVPRTEKMAATLGSLLGEEVVHFHGQLNDSEKRTNMDLFMSDQVRIVCATNAFGMGVDKGNIRGVIHRDIPGSIEALAQEVGRAGRDGQDSLCITFNSAESLKTQKFFIECSNPSPSEIRHVFTTLRNASDASGNVEMTISQLSQNSGVFVWKVGAVMEILKANRVIERQENKQKLFKIRIATPKMPSDERFKLWWSIVEMIGLKNQDQFYEVDMPSFVQQIGMTEHTVRNWLKKWQESGWIRFIPPFAGTPTKIVNSLNQIDFKRLEEKLEQANEKLEAVLEYMDTPDGDKHEFLEHYFELK